MRIDFNNSGFYDLRRHPNTRTMLEMYGELVMAAANATIDEDGYHMASEQGAKKPEGRWRVAVFTASDEAKRSNAKHNTLLRLINGIGGSR